MAAGSTVGLARVLEALGRWQGGDPGVGAGRGVGGAGPAGWGVEESPPAGRALPLLRAGAGGVALRSHLTQGELLLVGPGEGLWWARGGLSALYAGRRGGSLGEAAVPWCCC